MTEMGAIAARGGGLTFLGQLVWRLRYLYSIAFLLSAWALASEFGWVDQFLLPSIPSIVERGASEIASGKIFPHLAGTAYRTFVSLICASVLGVGIGTAMRVFPLMRWFWDPIVSAMFPIPKIAFMPIFILWFGTFDASKIIMTIFASIVPIISATYLGACSIDQHLFWSARSMGTPERKIILRVVVPASLPSILNGIQIATPLCLIVTVVTEMMTGGRGLGSYMIFATRFGESDKVFFGIIVTAAFGIALIEAIRLLRKLALPWHSEAGRTSE